MSQARSDLTERVQADVLMQLELLSSRCSHQCCRFQKRSDFHAASNDITFHRLFLDAKPWIPLFAF